MLLAPVPVRRDVDEPVCFPTRIDVEVHPGVPDDAEINSAR